MLAEMRYALRRLRGLAVGFGIGVSAFAMLLVAFWGYFSAQQEVFLDMLKTYPPEFLAFFGETTDVTSMATPQGYLNYYFFALMPVIVGFFAVWAGSGLLAADEEAGRLELIQAHPLTRTALFWGRVLALAVAGGLVLVVGWLGFIVLLPFSDLDLAPGVLALPFLSLLGQLAIYGALAVLLGTLLPSRNQAIGLGSLVLIAGYLLTALARLSPSLSAVARLLPYEYYQGGEAMGGLDVAALLGLLAVSLLFMLLAWRRYEQRDIRVSGEGSLRLPFSLRRRARA